MTNKEHVALVKQGSSAWNAWRRANPDIIPHLGGADLSNEDLSRADLHRAGLRGAVLIVANLSEANLSEANLSEANLSEANLSEANLSEANLVQADLSGADLSGANLSGADFGTANLRRANLSKAGSSVADFTNADLREANLRKATLISTNLMQADLRRADLSGANFGQANLSSADLGGADLSNADLFMANLSETNLKEANLSKVELGTTIFANNDLSTAKGLETVTHYGPSTIGIDTLFRSSGKIPEVFLRGAGVPEDFIIQIPSLIAAIQPIQFHSCFISYSHQDEQFSQRLHSRMRDEKLRVWYAPEDLKGGRKLHEEIFSAIQIHDKLLLVVSANSMKSEWVMTEIRRARKAEREENRRKLFPIRLVDFKSIKTWECFDADSGKDLAAELREFYIPDFSNWKDRDSFEREFAKLLRDLRATEN